MDGVLGGEGSSSGWLDATGMVVSWEHLRDFHSAYEGANPAGGQRWLLGSLPWRTSFVLRHQRRGFLGRCVQFSCMEAIWDML